MQKEYYSTTECAELLKVSRITVFNWIKQKKILFKKSGKNYIILASEIDKLLGSRSLRDEEKSRLRSFVNMLTKDYGDFLRTLD